MSYEEDRIDIPLLVTLILSGALLVVAGAYYAAGLYHRYQHEVMEPMRSVEPMVQERRQAQAAQKANLSGLDAAKEEVVREYGGR